MFGLQFWFGKAEGREFNMTYEGMKLWWYNNLINFGSRRRQPFQIRPGFYKTEIRSNLVNF